MCRRVRRKGPPGKASAGGPGGGSIRHAFRAIVLAGCASRGEADDVCRAERLPDPVFEDILGVSVPQLTTSAFEASTPAKLSRALSSFDAAHKRRI